MAFDHSTAGRPSRKGGPALTFGLAGGGGFPLERPPVPRVNGSFTGIRDLGTSRTAWRFVATSARSTGGPFRPGPLLPRFSAAFCFLPAP